MNAADLKDAVEFGEAIYKATTAQTTYITAYRWRGNSKVKLGKVSDSASGIAMWELAGKCVGYVPKIGTAASLLIDAGVKLYTHGQACAAFGSRAATQLRIHQIAMNNYTIWWYPQVAGCNFKLCYRSVKGRDLPKAFVTIALLCNYPASMVGMMYRAFTLSKGAGWSDHISVSNMKLEFAAHCGGGSCGKTIYLP